MGWFGSQSRWTTGSACVGKDTHTLSIQPDQRGHLPPSGELNILAKAREYLEDSEESGFEDAEAGAPGWSGTCKSMVIGSGYVDRRLCDG